MSIKRIETMTNKEIKELIDSTYKSDNCNKCPLCYDDRCIDAQSCIDAIIDWLYEGVDEPDTEDNVDFNDCLNLMNKTVHLSIVATAIHDLIRETLKLAGVEISASDFAQMIADHLEIEEESDND